MPAEAVRRRIGVVIGLDLDDPAADVIDQQRRPDQVGRNVVDAAGEERAMEASQMALPMLQCGCRLWRGGNIHGTFGLYPPTLAHPRRDLAIPFAEIEGRPKLL